MVAYFLHIILISICFNLIFMSDLYSRINETNKIINYIVVILVSIIFNVITSISLILIYFGFLYTLLIGNSTRDYWSKIEKTFKNETNRK